MALVKEQQFTLYGWLTCFWILIISFQYGWNISALNQIQSVLTCRASTDPSVLTYVDPKSGFLGLPTCVRMSDTEFSSITSIFCLGGLLGSLASDRAMDRWGRRGTARASGAFFMLGAGVTGVAWSLSTLLFGRFLVGVGAGGLSVAPLFLAEISPPAARGPVGSLNQMGIVLGIMFTQIAGFVFATPTRWRLVLLGSAALAAFQILISPLIIESPAWLRTKGRLDEIDVVHAKLYAGLPPREDDVEEDPLLNGSDEIPEDHAPVRPKETVSIPEMLRASDLRKPLFAVCLLFLSQQISGVNAILYYSNAILGRSFPTLGPYVSLAITLVNMLMTVPAIFLINRLGRKVLLFGSASGAVISLVLCGIGVNVNSAALASVGILTFVASFAIGMGPVPFVLIPEISPSHAVSALSSVGLATHWVANFTVGQTFLPLRNWLAAGRDNKEGTVFFVFALALAVTVGGFARVWSGLKRA